MPRLIVFLTMVVALLASKPAGAELERAVLDLVVNGSPRGEAFVFLNDGDVLIPLERLRQAGLTRLHAQTELHGGVTHVSLRAASPPLRFAYDEMTLTLDITAPPSVLAQSTLDLSPHAPPDLLYDYTPSIFLNYAPRLIDGEQFQTFAEAGVSVGAAVADTGVTYTPERGAIRLVSKAVFDDRANLRTATVGDAFVSAGPLGGAVMLGGASVVRNYALDPYLVKIPRLAYTGSAMAPSTIDVYVNDILIRRVPVDPGEFQLTNITPTTGAGTTRYVVRDAFGREQRLESTYYASEGVLAEGLSEYAYGVGLVRQGFGSESWSYGEPALVARHRFGVTNHITSGFHAEFDRSRANAGSDFTLAASLGEVEVHMAGSTTMEPTPRRGTAGLVAYSYRRGGTSLRTALRGATRDYSTLSLDPAQDRSLAEHVTSTGQVLGTSASLAADVAFAWLHDAGPTARLTLTLNTRLSKVLGLQVRTSRSRVGFAAWEHDVFSVLTVSLPGQHSGELTEHIGSRGSDVTARISRPLQKPTDVGYQVNGSVGSTQRAAATVQGQASFGRVAATYTNTEGKQNTMLEASGSVVLVGKGVYFTRPLTQSFAVLEVPGAPGVPGYLNNREIGKTDANGRLFIPDLLPYQSNRLSISSAELPPDYQLDEDEVLLAPPRRGGAVVTFPAYPVRLVRGWIERRDDWRFNQLTDGSVTVVTPEKTYISPIGLNGEFEFEQLPEGSWEGRVRSSDGRCRVSLHVQPSNQAVQDLGAVICSEAEPKAAQR